MLAPIARRACILFTLILLATGAPASAAAGEEITIPASDGAPAIPAHLARPAAAAERAPAVVVLHGCEGYRARYGAIADDLARHGMVAIAIDTLTPRGLTNSCGNFAGSQYAADYARATLAWLRTQPGVDPDHMALLGYSMGAIAVMDVADPRSTKAPPAGLAAAVAYYPSCARREAAHLTVPLAILDGASDDWTPAPPCTALAAAASAAGKTLTITTYPGATHAFNVVGKDRTAYGHPLRYDAVAAADAEQRTLAFLRTYLTPKK